MSAIIAVVEFKGDSKKIYPFNVYPLDEECLQESSVYVFTKRSLNSSTFKYKHNICFIGSAETIPNKLYDQQKKHCIDLNATNSVCYLAVPVEADRKTIERDLLKACNTLSSKAMGANFLSKPDALPY